MRGDQMPGLVVLVDQNQDIVLVLVLVLVLDPGRARPRAHGYGLGSRADRDPSTSTPLCQGCCRIAWAETCARCTGVTSTECQALSTARGSGPAWSRRWLGQIL